MGKVSSGQDFTGAERDAAGSAAPKQIGWLASKGGIAMGFLASTDSFQNQDINNTFNATQAQTANSNYAPAIAAGQQQAATGAGQEASGFNQLQGVGQQQQSFAQSLAAQAAGTGGPTMADTELTTATNQNNANAAAAAASGKGLNPAMAARLALNTQAGNNQTAANQAAQTRVQEQLNAQGQLGSALSGASSTAANAAGAGNTATGAGTSLLGTAAGAQNTQNANTIQNTLGTSAQNEQAALANQQGQLGVQAGNAQIAAANTAAQNSMIGSIAGGIGGAAAMFSDVRLKDIKKGSKAAQDIEDLLDHAHASEYEYKDGAKDIAGDGTYATPMAQDLEQSKLGADLVHEGPGGAKVVDYGKGLGTLLGATAHVNDKVDALANQQGQPARRSFAEQVAHHLANEGAADVAPAPTSQAPAGMADGGEAKTEAQKRLDDEQNAAASTSDLSTSFEAAAPKGEKNVQGVDLSQPGKAAPMRANVPAAGRLPKKYAGGGEVAPDWRSFAAGNSPDMYHSAVAQAPAGGASMPNLGADFKPNSIKDANGNTPLQNLLGAAGVKDGNGVPMGSSAYSNTGAGTPSRAAFDAANPGASAAIDAPPASLGMSQLVPGASQANQAPASMAPSSVSPSMEQQMPAGVPAEATASGYAYGGNVGGVPMPMQRAPGMAPPMGGGMAQRVMRQPAQNQMQPQGQQQSAMGGMGGTGGGQSQGQFQQNAMAVGGSVPGRAKVAGNDRRNDTVPTELSPGEVVLPRSVAHNPVLAKAFVSHLLKVGGSGPKALAAIKGKGRK